MENDKVYIQHPGKVVEDSRFSHMMALMLDPSTNYKRGLIRCITSRTGDPGIEGNVDRSELYFVHEDRPDHFLVDNRVTILDEAKIVAHIADAKSGWDFIGLEDPDIWIDKKTGVTHVYFTIPIRHEAHHTAVILGHAQGINLDSLEMKQPMLLPQQFGGKGNGAKELSIAPINEKGVRLNLIESSENSFDDGASVVQVAIAHSMDSPWEYGEILFHPKEHNISWIAGHASPGPLLPQTFIDMGKGKLLGILNGREASKHIAGKIIYGMFSIGLCIYDYENGKIDWVSPESFIRDSEARNITFASQFVETVLGEGILYAHVDDSFVRAYTLRADAIKSLLP